jgi:two-component system sensor histidine kinase KdpD
VYWNEKKAGRFTDTLPFAAAAYYPISGPRYPLGVIGLRFESAHPLTLDQETLLHNFISQIASTLEREQLNEMARKSVAIVESERLYQTLLNSISHELRTPITTILSGSEGLLDETALNHTQVRKDLATEIHAAADRLNRLIDNLLDMTRLESGRITPTLDWCDVHDLMNVAVGKLNRELSYHVVTIQASPDMPLVKVDFALIEQVLMNLLHNASLYTPSGSEVQIRAYVQGQDFLIEVSDNGPGFPKASLSRVFEKFYRVPGTKPGGTGLGLSIVRGFVEAHRGTISVENKEEGGTRFTMRLPLHSQNQATTDRPE